MRWWWLECGVGCSVCDLRGGISCRILRILDAWVIHPLIMPSKWRHRGPHSGLGTWMASHGDSGYCIHRYPQLRTCPLLLYIEGFVITRFADKHVGRCR
jgi:hypothetical protein